MTGICYLIAAVDNLGSSSCCALQAMQGWQLQLLGGMIGLVVLHQLAGTRLPPRALNEALRRRPNNRVKHQNGLQAPTLSKPHRARKQWRCHPSTDKRRGLCPIVFYTKLGDLHTAQEKGRENSIANYRNWPFFVQGQHIPLLHSSDRLKNV